MEKLIFLLKVATVIVMVMTLVPMSKDVGSAQEKEENSPFRGDSLGPVY